MFIFYFFILSMIYLYAQSVSTFKSIFNLGSLFLVLMLAFDVYYLLLSLYFFRASQMILELDLVYRNQTDNYDLFVN